MQKLISTCPACQGKMTITTLTCPDCGLELRGQFHTDNTATGTVLPQEDADFLKAFLENRGNMSQVQEQLGISYPTAKKRLDQALRAAGLYHEEEKEEEKEMMDVRNWRVDESSTKASEIVKRKLKECGGRATIRLYKGGEHEIWVMPDGKSFGCDGLGKISTEFEVFDVVSEYLQKNGGKAKKGLGRYRLGTENCGLDTLAGVIFQHYGIAVGSSSTDRTFIIFAVMEWAGLAKNARGELILKEQI